MALEPKPRPRAFRISSNTEASADQPPGPLVIETLADPYDAETRALLAKPDVDEAAVEAAQKKGVAARSLMSWGGIFWSATAGTHFAGIQSLADAADR